MLDAILVLSLEPAGELAIEICHFGSFTPRPPKVFLVKVVQDHFCFVDVFLDNVTKEITTRRNSTGGAVEFESHPFGSGKRNEGVIVVGDLVVIVQESFSFVDD
jgi:hypothetical protein